MLEIGNPESFLKLMDKAEKIGIDAMSAGVVLAKATEAFEKKIITKNQTTEELQWGYDTLPGSTAVRIVN